MLKINKKFFAIISLALYANVAFSAVMTVDVSEGNHVVKHKPKKNSPRKQQVRAEKAAEEKAKRGAKASKPKASSTKDANVDTTLISNPAASKKFVEMRKAQRAKLAAKSKKNAEPVSKPDVEVASDTLVDGDNNANEDAPPFMENDNSEAANGAGDDSSKPILISVDLPQMQLGSPAPKDRFDTATFRPEPSDNPMQLESLLVTPDQLKQLDDEFPDHDVPSAFAVAPSIIEQPAPAPSPVVSAPVAVDASVEATAVIQSATEPKVFAVAPDVETPEVNANDQVPAPAPAVEAFAQQPVTVEPAPAPAGIPAVESIAQQPVAVEPAPVPAPAQAPEVAIPAIETEEIPTALRVENQEQRLPQHVAEQLIDENNTGYKNALEQNLNSQQGTNAKTAGSKLLEFAKQMKDREASNTSNDTNLNGVDQKQISKISKKLVALGIVCGVGIISLIAMNMTAKKNTEDNTKKEKNIDENKKVGENTESKV